MHIKSENNQTLVSFIVYVPHLKYKVLIVLFALALLLFGSGITYSIFYSEAGGIVDQKIAKFVFDAQKLDNLSLTIDDLYPSSSKEYLFSVSNNYQATKSDVTLEYQMTIKTFHFMPLVIELYKITDNNEELLLTCNEEQFSRNQENELVCNSAVQQMAYDEEVLDNYKIKVTFPAEYNTLEYTELVDFLDVEIKSWQKLA